MMRLEAAERAKVVPESIAPIVIFLYHYII